MAGLIEKDIRLMMQRRASLFMLLVIAIFMATSTDGTFIIGYITFLSSIFTISTLAYDEYDNGYLFLMSLPIDAKTYALSKYIFSFGCGIISWIIGVILMFAVNFTKGIPLDVANNLMEAFAIFPVLALILDFMIPITLKYGSEKGRIVLLIVAGAISATAVLVLRLVAHTEVSEPDILTKIDSLPPALFIGIMAVLGILLTVASFLASVRIMKNKSY